MSMPSRFISRTRSRPKSVKPGVGRVDVVLTGGDPVREIPVELDLAQAHAVVAAQQFETAFDEPRTFGAQDHPGSTRALGFEQVGHRADQQRLVRVGFDIRQHAIEGHHRTPCIVVFAPFGGLEGLRSAPYLDVDEGHDHVRGHAAGDGRGEVGRRPQVIVAQQHHRLPVQRFSARFRSSSLPGT